MRKLYVPLVALALVGNSANGQVARDGSAGRMAGKAGEFSVRAPQRDMATRIARETIWSDDFSNPANWVVGTMDGANTDSWVIGTTGPTGDYADQVGTIASTTAANGFALFDSDLLCGGNQHATLTLAQPVDLSAYTTALLEFQQNYKRFYDNVWLDWSTNGTDWTAIQLNADFGHGAEASPTDNPELTRVNVSGLGGSATAYIRFRFESTPTSVNPLTNQAFPTDRVGCAYAWMVDDVAFVTPPEHEIRMDFGFVSTHEVLGPTEASEGWAEYGIIPTSQLGGTMTVGASIFNDGLATQTGVVMHVDFVDANDNVVPGFSGSFPVADIEFEDTVDAIGSIDIPSGLGVGQYTARFTMTGDLVDLDEWNPDDNSTTRYFVVSTDEYALDGLGTHPEDTEDTDYFGTFSLTGYSEFHAMNLYKVQNPMTVTGLYVSLATGTITLNSTGESGGMTVPGAGAELEAFIYADVAAIRARTPGMDDPLYSAFQGTRSEVHTVTAADVTAGRVGLAFDPPVTLPAGTYYACVRVKGSGTVTSGAMDDPEVSILDDETVPQPAWSSAIFIPNYTDETTGLPGPPTWTDGNAWGIRMTSSPSIGVREVSELTGISLFPNPTDGVFQINSDRSEVLFVEVTDAMGRIVHTSNFSYMTSIDLSRVAAGVYNVEVSSRNARSIHRVMVK